VSLTRVFVYGTLQRGGFFHAVLARSSFVGVAWTQPRYRLVDLGWYPGLLEGGSTAVRGEVWAVEPHTLDKMDAIEEHPHVYVRKPVELAGFTGVEGYVLRPEHAGAGRPIPTGVWRV
jgi:gamma-glutamylcyclotransferase (GGCT)/AIG2-like uncharacterized protein YtfP